MVNFAVNALLQIKRSLIDVNNNLSSWNCGDPCKSKWIGVLCSSAAMEDGHLHVTELHLVLNMKFVGESISRAWSLILFGNILRPAGY
ncbi:hypothetical protein LWI28_016314 [Acer negundo]|uniref:Leucine-rich repeat-containing N-terminal plant-type domain-containing protein n=1 Tax=Acer negundo TaxID=4023 RepID=A0AAD5JFJ7_ACENE|nr:hypothetical protein LWI28_016314 [Acer negundo]